MNRNILIAGGIILAGLIAWAVFPKGEGSSSTVEAASPSAKVAKELYGKAESLRKGGELVEAKKMYQEIVMDYPDMENIASIQKDLESTNMQIIFSNRVMDGKTVYHEVASGDTLGKIAKKYNTTVELIKLSNNLKGDTIRLGQKVRIWQGQFNIFVDKSQNILILKDANEIVKTYRVSTGENNSTPIGTFKVTTKLVDPVWFNKGIVVPPESPHNVLGTRWMGFDLPGYGIHGTVEPETIGQQVTAGCVRMRNEEVEELYSLIPAGTEVVIVD